MDMNEEDIKKQLLQAIKKSDIVRIQEIIKDDDSMVNAYFKKRNTTPLLEAIKAEQVDVVTLLLENGADVEETEKNFYQVSPLFQAISLYNDSLIDILLKENKAPGKQRIDVNRKNAVSLCTPLHWATKKKYPYAVTSLLSQKDIKVNLKDADENTPLHCAVITNQVKIVWALIVHKDINFTSTNKNNHIPEQVNSSESMESKRLIKEWKQTIHNKDHSDVQFLKLTEQIRSVMKTCNVDLQHVQGSCSNECFVNIVGPVRDIIITDEYKVINNYNGNNTSSVKENTVETERTYILDDVKNVTETISSTSIQEEESTNQQYSPVIIPTTTTNQQYSPVIIPTTTTNQQYSPVILPTTTRSHNINEGSVPEESFHDDDDLPSYESVTSCVSVCDSLSSCGSLIQPRNYQEPESHQEQSNRASEHSLETTEPPMEVLGRHVSNQSIQESPLRNRRSHPTGEALKLDLELRGLR